MAIFQVSHQGRHRAEIVEADTPEQAVAAFRLRCGAINTVHPYFVRAGETGEVTEHKFSEAAVKAEQQKLAEEARRQAAIKKAADKKAEEERQLAEAVAKAEAKKHKAADKSTPPRKKEENPPG